MTKNELNAGLAAIITTLAETETAPEGVMYAAFMSKFALDEFNMMLDLLKRSGNVESIGAHRVKITAAGRELADKINAFAAAH